MSILNFGNWSRSYFHFSFVIITSIKSIWCTSKFVRWRISGRQRVREERDAKKEANREKWTAAVLEAWLQRKTGLHSRVKISLDFILRRRTLGNNDTSMLIGEIKLSPKWYSRSLCKGLLDHCNLNLLTMWTGLLHSFHIKLSIFTSLL